MSDLSLAQNHAFDLARTLMVPVTLFEIDGEIGVMPSAEYDGDEATLLAISTSLSIRKIQEAIGGRASRGRVGEIVRQARLQNQNSTRHPAPEVHP